MSGRRFQGVAGRYPLPRQRTLAVAAVVLASCLSILSLFLALGCAHPEPVPAAPHDRLWPGVTYSADLDRDGSSELILVDKPGGSVTITDGDVVYHSRPKWHVAAASLGDTDRDGLPEVVTLLDDEEGRHIGLFAYFGGEYRERLVTSELSPRITDFRVVDAEDAMGTGDDLLVDMEPPAGQSAPARALFRWNGFSFTIVPK